jgi:hypothetical protein
MDEAGSSFVRFPSTAADGEPEESDLTTGESMCGALSPETAMVAPEPDG